MNIKKDLSNRIGECADVVGSPDELAIKSNIPLSTLKTYLSAKREPRISQLIDIAAAANKSAQWLIMGTEQTTDLITTNIDIPRHSLKLSAGGGSPVNRVKLIDYIPFTKEFFEKKLPHTTIKNLMIFDAAGDSMLPTINDGDLVMIDSSKNELGDGLYAFTIDNMAHIKRLQQTIDSTIIKSDNHELYDNYELKLEDQNRIRIIGKVVWKGSLL